jgi:hypothetical protein
MSGAKSASEKKERLKQMLIYQNRKSGKYFVLLNEIGNNYGYFITPGIDGDGVGYCQTNLDLFNSDPIEIDDGDSRAEGMLTHKQLESYRAIISHDKERKVNYFIKWVIETKDVDLEIYRKQKGDAYAKIIKEIRDNIGSLTVDDFD